MRAVIQRVSSASVAIGRAVKSVIGPGLLVLLGIGHQDGQEDIDWLVKKIAGLRIFDDDAGIMNRSVVEVGGDAPGCIYIFPWHRRHEFLFPDSGHHRPVYGRHL